MSYSHIRSSIVSRPAFAGALSLPSFFNKIRGPIWTFGSASPYWLIVITNPVSSHFHFFNTMSFSGSYAIVASTQFEHCQIIPEMNYNYLFFKFDALILGKER